MAHPLPVIANTALVTQKLTTAPELHDAANVFCVGYPAGSAMSDIADSFADAYAASLIGVVSNSLTMGVTIVTLLDGLTPTGTFQTDKLGTAGSHGTGNLFPLSIAQGITWQTAKRGKSFRGRSYIPGVTSDQVVDPRTRTLTATAQAQLALQASTFITSLAAQAPALTLQVLSRKLGVINAVTASRANVGCVEQRKRYEKVAHH